MPTAPQVNAALVRRFLTDVLAAGDSEAIDDFVAPDSVDHTLILGTSGVDDVVRQVGRRALAAADVDVAFEEVVATDTHVAVRGRLRGNERPTVVDPVSTGQSFVINCVWFCRIEEGRIAGIWALPDGLALLQAVGALQDLDEEYRDCKDIRDTDT